MIDGWPGTPWVVGTAFRQGEIPSWAGKDFSSPGRWIEVRMPELQQINRFRAVVSPWAAFELQVNAGRQWRAVTGERVVDDPPRHHSHASATTTACLDAVRTDRARIVFTEARQRSEVVFELACWYEAL